MGKYFLAVFIAVFFCGLSGAMAKQSDLSFDFKAEVPYYHWSYQALDYFQGKGFFDLCPDNYFIDREKDQLTRFQFAIYITSLMSQMSNSEKSPEEYDAIIVLALSNEYYAELKETSELTWWPRDPSKAPDSN